MKLIKKGLLTSIQDHGRSKFKNVGINTGGAMDLVALRLLNLVLENNENEAALEMHFPAAKILFEETCIFAIAGADFDAVLNNSGILRNKQYIASIGDVLRFEKKLNGQRAYFGVKGGFENETWLDSASHNSLLDHPKSVESYKFKRDFYELNINEKFGIYDQAFYASQSIRFVESKDFSSLDETSKISLIAEIFKISLESNRMAIKVEGPILKRVINQEMVSFPVAEGCMQLLPNGHLLILMKDCQVTGGYPVIGSVIAADLHKIAQMKDGNEFKFEKIELNEAIKLKLELDLKIENIAKALKLKRHA